LQAIGSATALGRNLQADRGRSRSRKIACKQAPTSWQISFIMIADWNKSGPLPSGP